MSRRSKQQAWPNKAAAGHPGAPGAKGAPAPGSASRPAGLQDRWTVPLVCLVLAAMTWVVFGQTLGHEFVNYDDDSYVTNNPAVLGGLSLKAILWAFTHNVALNWTPLTVISHMLDCQLYGTHAGGHHLTSVLLHMASVIVLFLVLKGMTAALWRSAFVAAVFAIHPLHVESVAWIAERRDVLSGLFFMVTLGAYARYVRHPWSLCRYLLVALTLALGLMSKPMVVTLPLVLLLLDYWPLKRFPQSGGGLIPWRLIVEKIPLLALSGAACVATIFAQKEGIQSLPLASRIGNAMVSYSAYLGQMIYPAGLAVYYPHPGSSLPLWKILAAFLLLLVISAGAFVTRRTRPWFLIGWLWYLGMLVPVIGILQVGTQARADRYTYLPQIGLYLLLTWAAVDLFAGWRHRGRALGVIATASLVALIWCARAQTSYWRNSESLWTRELACAADNAIARSNLGNALFQDGKVGEAIVRYQEALQIEPGYAVARNNLGNALLHEGRLDEAIIQFQKALEIKPDFAVASYNLGNALFQEGKVDEAIVHYRRALEIRPGYAEAHYNLGNACRKNGNVEEAIVHYQKAIEITPGYAEAHINLGNALFQEGKVDQAIAHFQEALEITPGFAEVHCILGYALLQNRRADEAIVHFQKALQIKPNYLEAQNNLAWVLATSPRSSLRNGNRAVELAQQADQLAGGENPNILRTLAAACAEAGRFGDARQSAQKAVELARAAGRPDLVEQLSGELKLYEAGLPFHQESK